MVNAIPGWNLPVLNFVFHLPRPWTDQFAHVNHWQNNPNFNMLVRLVRTKFFKGELFSCLPNVNHVINSCKMPIVLLLVLSNRERFYWCAVNQTRPLHMKLDLSFGPNSIELCSFFCSFTCIPIQSFSGRFFFLHLSTLPRPDFPGSHGAEKHYQLVLFWARALQSFYIFNFMFSFMAYANFYSTASGECISRYLKVLCIA